MSGRISFRKTFAAFGLAAALAGSPVVKAMQKPGLLLKTLEQVVTQETYNEQKYAEQKYAEIKKLFDEADSVGRGFVDKVPPNNALYEFNDAYNNICTVYSLKGVQVYKFNGQLLRERKHLINIFSRYAMASEQMNMLVTYKAAKPGAAIPPEVAAAAKKEGLALPVPDESTPDFKEDNEIIIFVKNIDAKIGVRKGLLSYLPATAGNLQVLEKVFSDYHPNTEAKSTRRIL